MARTSYAELNPSDEVISRAREALAAYSIVVEPLGAKRFQASAREMRGVIATADSPAASVTKLQFMLETALAALLQDGKPVPPALSSARRTEQINIRLSTAEKAQLEEEAAQKGFAGVSALVRSKALAS